MPIKHSANPDRVREICRQLKPLLGEKMEQVFKAYLAEDETGKQQLEAYLELLQAKYMPVRLDDVATQLVPPNPAQAYGEYELGTILYGGHSRGRFGLRENEWIQHVGIFGRTGAGKTNLGFKIVEELVKHGKPVLVLDWKRNYRDLLTKPLFKGMKVYTIGRSVTPFTFNPLIPPPGTNPKTWLKKLNEVIAHSYMLGNGVLYLLQQILNELYLEFGVYDGTVQRWPTFQNVLDKARKLDVRGREAGWLSSTLRALASLCFGDMGDLVNHPSANSPEALLDKTVILELDALTQQDKIFFVSALLLWIHHQKMIEPTREQFKQAIIVEEAHHVLSDERKSLVGGQSVMEITFREIREYGVGILALDQVPSQISPPTLGNTYTTICLNLKHSKDVSAMSQCMLLEGDEKDILGSLEVGQAVVKLQGRIQGPFMIQIPEFRITKGAVTDEMVRQHMGFQAAVQPASMPGRSRNEASSTTASTVLPAQRPGMDDLVLAFLRDVEVHPESGIAERYKRLGISVRQGQKSKFLLLEAHMIEDHEEFTRVGRIRKIMLTEKGRRLLDKNTPAHKRSGSESP